VEIKMSELESDTSEEPISLVDAAEPQLGEGEYFLTDGIKGAGDSPDWYLSEKYKSVSDQAAAYNELSKKFGAFKGAPKDGYSMPEGIDKEDELMQELMGFANESNMSQDYFDKAWDLLSVQSQVAEEVSAETEIAKLGDNATDRIKTVEQFMKNSLDTETYERLRYAVNSAQSVELVEALIRSTAPAKLPIDGHIQPGGMTWGDIEREMFRKDEHGNLMRSVDSSHEKKIQGMMKEFGGDKPYSQQFG
tara:strand:+ start:655 stop:1401 length:747 start_codon:yes stop_codon:yes gene_type:complete